MINPAPTERIKEIEKETRGRPGFFRGRPVFRVECEDFDALLPYARLGATVIEERTYDHGGDIDGGWLQDAAIKCGVLEWVDVSEPCDPEFCHCAEYYGTDEFPVKCLRIAAENGRKNGTTKEAHQAKEKEEKARAPAAETET